MVKNEYDVSGHINIPFNKNIQDVFFREGRENKYALYKNGLLIEKRTNLSKGFVNSYLLKKGYKLKKTSYKRLIPVRKINGITIGVTKINSGSKTIELLISIHAKDMRSVIERCDAVVEYVESVIGQKIPAKAKLWTRQEMC